MKAFVALTYLIIGSAVLAQSSNEQKCKDTKKLLADLEAQATKLQTDLSYTKQSENGERNVLGTLNKAIADPQRNEPGHFFHVVLSDPDSRRYWLGVYGLPWKDEYFDDLPLLRALRDATVQKIERIKYVLANNTEIQQQKAGVDQQIAYRRNQLAVLGCDGSAGVTAIQSATPDASTPSASTPGPTPAARAVNDANQVTVPNFAVFDNVLEMKAVLSHAGLSGAFVVFGEKPPSKDKEFKFASQDPAPDTKVAPGATVTISIYPKYGASVIVPDLSVFDGVSEMKAVLNHAGLTGAFVAAGDKPPSKDKEFKFAGQDPVPDTQVEPGSAVTVSIYQKFGEEAQGTVPNVVGLTLDQAQKALATAGLNVGGITVMGKPPSAEKANKIASQEPAAGDKIPDSKLVSLKQYGSFKEGTPSPKHEPSIPEPSGEAGDLVGTWQGGTDTITEDNLHPAKVGKTVNTTGKVEIVEKDGKPFVTSWGPQQQRYEGGRIICEFQDDHQLRRETYQFSGGKLIVEKRIELRYPTYTAIGVDRYELDRVPAQTQP